MAARRPARLQHFDYIGPHRYFVTCCASARHHAFIDPEIVDVVRTQMLRSWADRGFEEIAAVLMPDHAHVLVEGGECDAEFRPAMTLMRQRTAVAYARLKERRLWQDGYYERVLRHDEDTGAVVGYMLDNPLRAGIVAKRADYPFSWSKYGLEV